MRTVCDGVQEEGLCLADFSKLVDDQSDKARESSKVCSGCTARPQTCTDGCKAGQKKVVPTAEGKAA